MRRLEILGIILAIAVVVGTPAAAFGYESFLRSQNPDEITIISRAPENGNWSPSTIRVKQGQRVKLRLTSDDVTHGIVIAGYNVGTNNIYPGKFTTVEFIADKVGEFPFVCTILCSPQHGAMAGKLIVEGTPGQVPQALPSAPAKEQASSVSRPGPAAPAKEQVSQAPKQEPTAPAKEPVAPATKTQSGVPPKEQTAPAPKPEVPVQPKGQASQPSKSEPVAPPEEKPVSAQPAPAQPAPAAAGPSPQDLAAGEVTFQAKCLACHGAAAKGSIGPALAGMAPESVVERVRKSGGAMPAFSPAALSDADLAKLGAYLFSLGK